MSLLRIIFLLIQLFLATHLVVAQIIWVKVQELPPRLEQKYGRDSIERLLSQRIIEAQHQFTQEQYGYQDTMRIGSFPDATAPGTFCLQLNVSETIEGKKARMQVDYAFFEKYRFLASIKTPFKVDTANIERQLTILSGLARVVSNSSLATYVNTAPRNLHQPQIDSLRQAEQDFYYMVVAYQPSAKISVADRTLAWAMIQNQWNETQAKLRYVFKANFNLYFDNSEAFPEVHRRLTHQLPHYIKVTYVLEPSTYLGQYALKAKIEFKNVSDQTLSIEPQIIDSAKIKPYPYATLGNVAGAYLGMKELFGL